MTQLALSLEPVARPKRSIVATLRAATRCREPFSAWDVVATDVHRLQRNVVAKRLSEAHALLLVERVGSRSGPLGQPETTWRLTAAGARIADGAAQ